MGVRDAEVVELVKLEDGKGENFRLGVGWGCCIKGGRWFQLERFFQRSWGMRSVELRRSM